MPPVGDDAETGGNCSCSLLLPFGFAHVQSQVRTPPLCYGRAIWDLHKFLNWVILTELTCWSAILVVWLLSVPRSDSHSVCRNWFSKSMWFSILAGEFQTLGICIMVLRLVLHKTSIFPSWIPQNNRSDTCKPQIDLCHVWICAELFVWVLWIS